jgi:polyisoprenoid-binding protein YceI
MSATSTAVQAPPAGRYAIDPAGSSVTFVTKHMFGLGKVRARLKMTRGVITIADPPEDSRVEAEVSASSFSTRNLMRDPQVRSRLFLDVRHHPAISFCFRQHPAAPGRLVGYRGPHHKGTYGAR